MRLNPLVRSGPSPLVPAPEGGRFSRDTRCLSALLVGARGPGPRAASRCAGKYAEGNPSANPRRLPKD